MIIKGLIDEDFVNYKKPSMTIMFPRCSFKCDKECGMQVCQNSALASAPDIEVDAKELTDRFMSNSITTAVVCAGLEPFDSPKDLLGLVREIRMRTDHPIIIYTGYTKQELISDPNNTYDALRIYSNIIVKFGRFIPGGMPHMDEVLGVELIGDNQYAEVVSR